LLRKAKASQEEVLPDAKPSEPVTDPIPLKDLVQAFASTVAATSHNLDQATVDLRNLYQNSGNALLAMMLPPRFTLDEISIDLSFVVISASPDEFSDQLPPESKQVGRATLEDPDTLSVKLAGAAKDDALADAQAKSANKAQGIQITQTNLQNGQAQLQNAHNQQLQAQKELNEASIALGNIQRARPPQPAQIAPAAIRMQQAQAKFNAATAQFNQLTAVWGTNGSGANQLNRDIQGLTAQKQALDAAAITLSGKDPLTSDQIDAVRRAGVDYKAYDAMWASFYKKYVSLRSSYDEAVQAFQAKSQIPKMDDFQLSGDDNTVLNKINSMTTGWKTVQDKVQKIVDDDKATLAALNALVQLIARIKGSGLKVRVDPKALADAPVEARQKLHLSFHTQLQQNVKVGDQDIAIGG
jgi:hypothetical protein